MSATPKKITRITRKTSLRISCAMSKSVPTSPTADKKAVHFADADGQELVYVKTYVPSYDDLDALRKVFLKNGSFISKRGSVDDSAVTDRRFKKLRGSATRMQRFAVTQVAELNMNSLSSCFDSLDIDDEEVEERLKKKHVLLKDMVFHNRTVKGYIIVSNLAFEKRIFVRHTFDDWKTFLEVEAFYIPIMSNEECLPGADNFMFSIDFPKSAKILLFALQYCVCGKEYWDNNDGNNYKIADFCS